jgi:hypothetical protein
MLGFGVNPVRTRVHLDRGHCAEACSEPAAALIRCFQSWSGLAENQTNLIDPPIGFP